MNEREWKPNVKEYVKQQPLVSPNIQVLHYDDNQSPVITSPYQHEESPELKIRELN